MVILSMAVLVVIVVSLQRAIYRRFWDRRLHMNISFSASEAFEGDRLVLREELTNAKPLPLPWVTAKFRLSRNLLFLDGTNFRVSDDYYQSDMFSISMYQRITRNLEFLCGRRGYYKIKSMELVSSNIFISQKLLRHLDCGAALTVYPRLIPFEKLDVVFRQLYGDVEVRRFINPDPFAFQGIREYLPTDSFRQINFKATAKTGELMVNVNSATASRELVILLNLQPYGDWASEDVYEESIRIAASAAERFCSMGLSVGLRSNGLDVTTGDAVSQLPGSGEMHFFSILEQLARIDLSLEQEPMSAILDKLRDPVPVYLLISSFHGRDMTDAFERMLENGLDVHWVLPAMADVRLAVEESQRIVRWEVKPYDALTNFYKKAAG